MEVPPEIKIPSTIGLPELVAAPAEIFVIVLPKTLAAVPPEIAIPDVVPPVENIPVKFRAEKVLLVMELAPVAATEIPCIEVGEVLEEVKDNVLPLIVVAVALAPALIPVTEGEAQEIVTEFPVAVAEVEYP